MESELKRQTHKHTNRQTYNICTCKYASQIIIIINKYNMNMYSFDVMKCMSESSQDEA